MTAHCSSTSTPSRATGHYSPSSTRPPRPSAPSRTWSPTRRPWQQPNCPAPRPVSSPDSQRAALLDTFTRIETLLADGEARYRSDPITRRQRLRPDPHHRRASTPTLDPRPRTGRLHRPGAEPAAHLGAHRGSGARLRRGAVGRPPRRPLTRTRRTRASPGWRRDSRPCRPPPDPVRDLVALVAALTATRPADPPRPTPGPTRRRPPPPGTPPPGTCRRRPQERRWRLGQDRPPLSS